jgi:hypothetical protein
VGRKLAVGAAEAVSVFLFWRTFSTQQIAELLKIVRHEYLFTCGFALRLESSTNNPSPLEVSSV